MSAIIAATDFNMFVQMLEEKDYEIKHASTFG